MGLDLEVEMAKKNRGEPMAGPARGRGRPEKPLEKIPAEFEDIVKAVLKPERKEEVAKD